MVLWGLSAQNMTKCCVHWLLLYIHKVPSLPGLFWSSAVWLYTMFLCQVGVYLNYYSFIVFFVFLQYWGLNSIQPLSHSTSPFLWFFFLRSGLANYLPGLLWTTILLISASWVARITGTCHQCLALLLFWLASNSRSWLGALFCEGWWSNSRCRPWVQTPLLQKTTATTTKNP
jgi:hypothetical protein